MFFKRNKNPDEQNNLYISIDGRSIGISFYTGFICDYSDRRIHIAGESVRPIEALFTDILYGFKHENKKPIDNIYVILENPWVKEVYTTIKDRRLKPFVVTESTISDLINKDIKNNQNDNKNVGLSYAVEHIKLNGYSYDEPVGKISEEIEISLTKFYGDKEIIDTTQKIVNDFWNKTKISYVTGPEYLFKIGKNLCALNDMFIMLGSTDTTIRLYSQCIVTEKIIIPYGYQNLLQKLNQKWSTASTDTANWLNLFLKNSLDEKEKNRIESDLKEAILDYIDLFNKANYQKTSFILERPITVFGADDNWNKLLIYMLKNKYFGEIFPHIENSNIVNITDKIRDLKGDLLIGVYFRMNTLLK